MCDVGGETDHRGIGRREHQQEGHAADGGGRQRKHAHRAVRECEGSGAVYREDRGDDRAEKKVVFALTVLQICGRSMSFAR